MQKIETENGEKIHLGITLQNIIQIMNKKYFPVEDFIENKKFPKAMQFYHQYPIRTKNGDIFTEPGIINYTIEFRDSDGISQYKEVFIRLHWTY